MHPLDAPAEEDKPTTSHEPSRESIASFWIGIAGVAIFSNVAANAVQWMQLQCCHFLWSNPGAFQGVIWNNVFRVESLVSEGLLPSIVTTAVVPILFWRGGLTQRIAISVVFVFLGFGCLGITYGNSYNFAFRWLSVLAITVCWSLLPILFLYTPIKTWSLRSLVAFLLLSIVCCLGVIAMLEMPMSSRVVYWEAVYGSAILCALTLRNWGSFALLESGATNAQVERTSSRTMLEIMMVCAFGCAVALYWGRSANKYDQLELHVVCGAILGAAVMFLSVWAIALSLGDRRRSSGYIGFVWILLWLASGGMFVARCFAGEAYGHLANTISLRGGVARDSWFLILLATFISSGVWLLSLIAIANWLKLCGWRIAEKRAETQDDA